MVQAFGVPAFPVDTHIHRLSERWGLSDGSSVTNTEADLKRTFDRSLWNGLHLRIIYFGREHCPALRHDPSACPICSWAAPKKKRAKTATKKRTRATRRR
jgi:endonuclease-3